jgi:hypothetical protein
MTNDERDWATMHREAMEAKQRVFAAQDAAGGLEGPHAENCREWLTRIRSMLEAIDREVDAKRNGWKPARIKKGRAR